jgi:hypothetical protein
MIMRYTSSKGSSLNLTVGREYAVRLLPSDDLGKPRILVLADDTGKPCRTRTYRFSAQ